MTDMMTDMMADMMADRGGVFRLTVLPMAPHSPRIKPNLAVRRPEYIMFSGTGKIKKKYGNRPAYGPAFMSHTAQAANMADNKAEMNPAREQTIVGDSFYGGSRCQTMNPHPTRVGIPRTNVSQN